MNTPPITFTATTFLHSEPSIIEYLQQKEARPEQIVELLKNIPSPFSPLADGSSIFQHLLQWAQKALEADRKALFSSVFEKYQDFFTSDLRFENDLNLLHFVVQFNLPSLLQYIPATIRQKIFFEWKWHTTPSQVLNLSPCDFEPNFFDAHTKSFWIELEKKRIFNEALSDANFEKTESNLQKALGWAISCDQPISALAKIIDYFPSLAESAHWIDPATQRPILHVIVHQHFADEQPLMDFLSFIGESPCLQLLKAHWNEQTVADILMEKGCDQILLSLEATLRKRTEDADLRKMAEQCSQWLLSMKEEIELFNQMKDSLTRGIKALDEKFPPDQKAEKIRFMQRLLTLRRGGMNLFYELFFLQDTFIHFFKKLCGDPFETELLQHFLTIPLSNTHPLCCDSKETSTLFHLFIQFEKWEGLSFLLKAFPLETLFWTWKDQEGKTPQDVFREKNNRFILAPPEELLSRFSPIDQNSLRQDAAEFMEIVSNQTDEGEKFEELFHGEFNDWIDSFSLFYKHQIGEGELFRLLVKPLINFSRDLQQPSNRKFFLLAPEENRNVLHELSRFFTQKHDSSILNTFNDFLYYSCSWVLNQSDTAGNTPIDYFIRDGRLSLLLDLREALSKRILSSWKPDLIEDEPTSIVYHHNLLETLLHKDFVPPEGFDEEAEKTRKKIHRWLTENQKIFQFFSVFIDPKDPKRALLQSLSGNPMNETEMTSIITDVLKNRIDFLINLKFEGKLFFQLFLDRYADNKKKNNQNELQSLVRFFCLMVESDQTKVLSQFFPLKNIERYASLMGQLMNDLVVISPETASILCVFPHESPSTPSSQQQKLLTTPSNPSSHKRKRLTAEEYVCTIKELSDPLGKEIQPFRQALKGIICHAEQPQEVLRELLYGGIDLPQTLVIEDPFFLYQNMILPPLLVGPEAIANANSLLQHQRFPGIEAFPAKNLGHLAIEKGNPELLAFLLEFELIPPPSESDSTLYLFSAIGHSRLENWKSQLEMMEMLMKQGAKIDEVNYRGWSPLYLFLAERFEILNDPAASVAYLEFFERHHANPLLEERECAILTKNQKDQFDYSPLRTKDMPLLLLATLLNSVDKLEKRAHLVPIHQRWLGNLILPETSLYTVMSSATGKKYLTYKKK